MERLPKLRTDIQLLPAEAGGQRVLALKDMIGLRKEILALNPEVAPLLMLFDGDHTVQDLQEFMMRSMGNQLVLQSDVEQLVRELDSLLVLQTESYLHKKQEIRRQFAEMKNRPPALAGSGYPEEPGAARKYVEEILAAAGPRESFPAVRALIAPHIDLRVGAKLYGEAYARLADQDFERIVILGTGHGLDDGLFSLTDKIYETPLGSFPPDRGNIERLRRAAADCLSPDDFAHRAEHSIEFQVLFLRAVLQRDIPLIAILAGGLGELLMQYRRIADIPGTGGFLDVLKSLCGPGTLLVAGVDFCHVGLKFGHPAPAAAYQAEIEEHDRRLLTTLCRGSAEEFWAESQRVEDRYHVCGLTALATVLEVLAEPTGTVLGYDVWHETDTRSAVSYAAAMLR